MQKSLNIPTQDHLQDLLLICLLQKLGVTDNTYIIPILSQEIIKTCPEIHWGDEPWVLINPDDLTLEFLTEPEIQEISKDPTAFKLGTPYTVAESPEDPDNDITFRIFKY